MALKQNISNSNYTSVVRVTLENVYKHADKMNKTFGLDSFEE